MSQTEAQEETYDIKRIIKIMRISAMMLELSDKGNRPYHELNLKQADMLRIAARSLAAQYEHNDGETNDR